MAAKYIIRFDDFYTGMSVLKFNLISDWILAEKIPAIIGFTPAWKPGAFSEFLSNDLITNKSLNTKKNKTSTIDTLFFIERFRHLKNNGCEIGLHGYTHECFKFKNILNVNPFGEFAGLPYEEQKNRIKKGKDFFEAHGIPCRIFMPPGHSFDQNTLKALYHCGLRIITDGKAFYPYKEYGIIFIPQISSQMKAMPFGIVTICLHPQYMSDQSFNKLRNFTSSFRHHIISVDCALKYLNSMGSLVKMFNTVSRLVYKAYKNVRNV